MAWGDRYRYLVKTPSGLTPESPYTTVFGESIPNPFDCFQWRTVAHQLVDKVWAQFVKLGELEEKEVKAGRLKWEHSKWNELNGPIDGLFAEKKKEDVMCVSPGDGVPRAVSLALDAVALLDQVDTAMEAIKPGSVPKHVAPAGGGPTPPSGPATIVDKALPWLIGGALLFGVYYFERREAQAGR